MKKFYGKESFVDELSVAVLSAEMKEDCRVIAEAASLARSRYNEKSPSGTEAAAYQLTRCYNVIEQLAMRIATAFENHIDDRQGWHTELVRRLSLEIPGVRPAFFPSEMLSDLRDMRGFRHVFVPSYDLVLNPNNVCDLVARTERVAILMPTICENFTERVRSNLQD